MGIRSHPEATSDKGQYKKVGAGFGVHSVCLYCCAGTLVIRAFMFVYLGLMEVLDN